MTGSSFKIQQLSFHILVLKTFLKLRNIFWESVNSVSHAGYKLVSILPVSKNDRPPNFVQAWMTAEQAGIG